MSLIEAVVKEFQREVDANVKAGMKRPPSLFGLNRLVVVMVAVLHLFCALPAVRAGCKLSPLDGAVTIPAEWTEIPASAFSGCLSLTSIHFAANSNLLSIGQYAFYNSGLTGRITIPASVISIDAGAFESCPNLTDVEFAANSNLVSIRSNAFEDSALAGSIIIPASVISIEARAFKSCPKLTGVIISCASSVTISSGAFESSSLLTSITLPPTASYMGSDVTAMTLTACSLCPAGKYSATGDDSGIACSDCDAGYASLNPGLAGASNAACPACQRGSYSTAGSACSACEVGYTTAGVGTAGADQSVCGTCAQGFYSASGLASTATSEELAGCSVCAVGYSTPGVGTAGVRGTAACSVCAASYSGTSSGDGYSGCSLCGEDKPYTMVGNGQSCTALSCKLIDRYGHITIPASVTSLKPSIKWSQNGPFYECSSLKSVDFAANGNLLTISTEAFAYSGLTSVTIPASVTSIVNSAFWYCSNLRSVEFAPDSNLQTIGAYAFQDAGLAGITIPASVRSIESNAFNRCQSLSTVEFAAKSNLLSIGQSAFEDSALAGSIIIPASVISIEAMAFQSCPKLSGVIISCASSVTISSGAFESSSLLTSITLPSTATYTGNFGTLKFVEVEPCSLCPAGKYSATGDDSGIACSDCDAGYASLNPGLAGASNAACPACQRGSYSTAGSACSACEAGYTTPGTATSGADGKVCSVCAAGYAGASSDGNSGCVACVAGSYSIAGAAGCSTCEAGYTTPGTAASACSVCAAGYAGASSDGNSGCVACVAGSYSIAGSARCSTCEAGYTTPGTATSGADGKVCSVCAAGYAGASSDGNSGCVACIAGSYSIAGAAGCSTCEAGYTTPGTAASACSVCAAGYAGMETCARVDAGYCAADTAGTACLANGATGATKQMICGAGKYNNAAGEACKVVQAGYCAADTAGTACLTDGATGATKQMICGAGTYNNAAGEACKVVQAGYCAADTAGTACLTDGATGATKQMICGAGTYNNAAGEACKACPCGAWQDSPGSTRCSTCGLGYYIPAGSPAQTNAGLCAACPSGKTTSINTNNSDNWAKDVSCGSSSCIDPPSKNAAGFNLKAIIGDDSTPFYVVAAISLLFASLGLGIERMKSEDKNSGIMAHASSVFKTLFYFMNFANGLLSEIALILVASQLPKPFPIFAAMLICGRFLHIYPVILVCMSLTGGSQSTDKAANDNKDDEDEHDESVSSTDAGRQSKICEEKNEVNESPMIELVEISTTVTRGTALSIGKNDNKESDEASGNKTGEISGENRAIATKTIDLEAATDNAVFTSTSTTDVDDWKGTTNFRSYMCTEHLFEKVWIYVALLFVCCFDCHLLSLLPWLESPFSAKLGFPNYRLLAITYKINVMHLAFMWVGQIGILASNSMQKAFSGIELTFVYMNLASLSLLTVFNLAVIFVRRGLIKEGLDTKEERLQTATMADVRSMRSRPSLTPVGWSNKKVDVTVASSGAAEGASNATTTAFRASKEGDFPIMSPLQQSSLHTETKATLASATA